MMLNDGELVINNQRELDRILAKAIQVLYGKSLENTPKVLFSSCYQAITDRFINITLSDVQNSYREAVIEKREYVALTRDELIQPVANYWSKKQKVQLEIDKFKNLSEKEKESEQKQLDFIESSKKKYIESLSLGNNLLDEFESNCIARSFADRFEQSFKDNIWKEAIREYKTKWEEVDSQFGVVPPKTMIFSRMIIEECIKRNYKLIID